MRAQMEKVNGDGTNNVVEACQTGRKPKMVYKSSAAAVGASFVRAPMKENSAYNSGHLNLGYFETKKEAEDLARSNPRRGRIESVILNPSTIYGPGDAKK